MTRAALVLALLASSLTAAHADGSDATANAAAAYAEGQQLYSAQRYDEAAAKFKDAWASDPDPAYLFNIAQSLRFAKRCSEAASYYRKFLAEVTSAPNLDQVHGYLAEVDACAKTQAPPPPQVRSARPRGTLGLIVAGSGIVLVGAGAVFLNSARILTEDHDRVIGACTVESPCDGARILDYEQAGDFKARIALRNHVATGLFIAGGAALATGIFLYVRRGRAEPSVAITPTASGAMVTTSHSF